MAHAGAVGWQCFHPDCTNRSTGAPCKSGTQKGEDMNPTEYAQNLMARGYEEVPGFIDKGRTLNVGDRVRKNNQLFGYDTGTGTIERVFVKEKSSWSQTYRADDVELIIKNDDGTYSFVADYHVTKVG